MEINVRKILSIVLLIVFVGSTIMMIQQNFNYKAGRNSYSEAEKLSGVSQDTPSSKAVKTLTKQEVKLESDLLIEDQEVPGEEIPETWVPAPVYDDPHVEALLETDLAALREVNEDVIGWIMIPDTVINYPLLQGEDNHYYLDYTWDGQENRVGSIFMESTNNPDLSDFHTIIYGHNLREKTMFSAIRNYKKQEFWEEHPYVYVVTDAGVYRYEIYSSYEAGVTSDTYRLGFKEQGKQVFIDMGLEQSVISTGVTPETTDRILTLSTCTGNGHATRWVVQARLKMVTESSLEESM